MQFARRTGSMSLPKSIRRAAAGGNCASAVAAMSKKLSVTSRMKFGLPEETFGPPLIRVYPWAPAVELCRRITAVEESCASSATQSSGVGRLCACVDEALRALGARDPFHAVAEDFVDALSQRGEPL